MDKLKTTVAAGAMLAGAATGAFAETCYPVGDIMYTNDDGVSTTVYAVVDEPIDFERKRSTGVYIHPEDAKSDMEAKKGRNLAINGMMALVTNDTLRDTFDGQAGPGLASHLVAPATLCVSGETVRGIKADSEPVANPGIKYEGDRSKVTLWALKK